MTSASNPIIRRVKGHKHQVQGMLTPGMRTSSDAAQPALSSIFTHFGVGKLKTVASRMRFIDHRKMGNVQSAANKEFSEIIPRKFNEVQSLLHINPSVNREQTIWSEMDKTLPTQSSSQYEEPAQPGELRAGSVIQKFSMFPKEGQSIASFKEQSRSLPKPKSTSRVATKKPKILPNTRRFSSVQEVSSAQQPSADTAERSLEKPASAKPDTVQRQADSVTPPAEQIAPPPPAVEPQTAPSLAVADVVEKAASAPELLLAKSKADAPKAQPDKKTPQETPPVAPLAKAKPLLKKPTVAEKKNIASSTSKPAALPVKPSLPKAALVVQRKLDTPAQKPGAKPVPPQAQPQARQEQAKESPRAESRPTLEQAEEKPQVELFPAEKQPALTQPAKPQESPAKTSEPVDLKVAQSLAKAPEPADLKLAQPLAKTQKPADTSLAQPFVAQKPARIAPEKAQQAPAEPQEATAPEADLAAAKPQLAPLAPQSDESAPPAMPLHQKIQARRAAPKAIKTLHPERLLPAKAPPLMVPSPRPMISKQKYSHEPEMRAEAQPAPLSLSPTARFETLSPQTSPSDSPSQVSMPHSAPAQPQAKGSVPVSRTVTAPASQQPLSMALAYASHMAQTAPGALEQKELPREIPLKEELPLQPRETLPEKVDAAAQKLTSNSSFSSNTVVQRQPDEARSADAPIPKAAALDLDQLAEDVLPFVKRILEIETERIPGSLR